MHIGVCSGRLMERAKSEDLDADGRVIKGKENSKEQDGLLHYALLPIHYSSVSLSCGAKIYRVNTKTLLDFK